MAQTPSLEEIKQQCIFCQIISGSVASKKIYEDDKVIAVLDINPANPGHMLVIPKEHYSIMPQIPDFEIEHLGMIAKALSRSAISSIKAQGTTIFIANGVAAGQRAQHFMMHIIPRLEKDDVGIEILEKNVQGEDFEKIHSALIQGVSKIFGIQQETKRETNKIDEKEIQEHKKAVKEKNRHERTKESSLDDIAKFLTGK